MPAIDLLLKLSTHGVNWQVSPGLQTSPIETSDIAAAAASLPLSSYLFAMYFFLQQERHGSNLFQCLYQDILHLWEKREWQVSSGMVKEELAALLAILAIQENKRAGFDQKCGGKGVIDSKTCRRCDGTGYLRFTDTERYHFLRIKKTTYYRIYKNIYHECFNLLLSYGTGISEIMKKQLLVSKQQTSIELFSTRSLSFSYENQEE